MSQECEGKLPELLEPDGSNENRFLTSTDIEALSRNFDHTTEHFSSKHKEHIFGDGLNVYVATPVEEGVYIAKCAGLTSEYDRIKYEAEEVFPEEDPFRIVADFARQTQRAYWDSEKQAVAEEEYSEFSSESANITREDALENHDGDYVHPSERNWNRIDQDDLQSALHNKGIYSCASIWSAQFWKSDSMPRV